MNNIEILSNIKELKNQIDAKFEIAKTLIDVEFRFENINFLDVEKISHVLYYIEISDSENFNSTNFLSKFINFKKNNPKIKLPQVNNNNISKILYVGKSSTDFNARIKCHFGNNSLSTYAIHYETWKNLPAFKDLKLDLYYYHFKNPIDKEILEIIETSLHLKLKPLLGRSGH